MTSLRCGDYTEAEARRDLARLHAENDAIARRLAAMSKGARDVARMRALRSVPPALAVDVRADFIRAERLAQRDVPAAHVAPVIRLGRARRASHRGARRVDGGDDSEGDPAAGLRAVVEVFRILNQWHEEQGR